MSPRGLRSTGLTLIAAGLVAGCATRGAGDTRRTLLEQWSQEFIVGGYQDLSQRADDLESALSTLCSAPSVESVEAARDSWSEAQEALKEAEVFRFGPYSRPEYAIGNRIDSWPVQEAAVNELLSSDRALDAESAPSFAVTQRGLPVLEYLLFATTDLEALSTPRRCEYLQGLGSDFAANARALHDAWAPAGDDFASQLTGAGRTSTAFDSLNHAFSEVVNRMGILLVNVRAEKLERPLGDEATGTPAPDLVESRYSARSIANIQDNLDGFERLYFGTTSVPGLTVYVQERGRNLDSELRQALDAARAALMGIPGPLSEAVTNNPDSVRAASTALGALQSLMQVDVNGVLGLMLTFNDNDGD